MHDLYGKVKIKIDPSGKEYVEGDSSPLPDGIYLGWEGAVVILNGIFIGEFPFLYDRHGTVHGVYEFRFTIGRRQYGN